jgi:predicted ATPase with chaperone activity
MAMDAKAGGINRLLVPASNAQEEAVVECVNVNGVGALGEAVDFAKRAPVVAAAGGHNVLMM